MITWILASAMAAPLELDAVLASVDATHPLLEAEMYRIEAAEGEVLAARGAFDPMLKEKFTGIPLGDYEYLKNATSIVVPTTAWGTSVYTGWDLGIGEIPAYYGEYETPPQGEFYVGVDVPLLRDGAIDKRRQTLKKSLLDVDVATAGVGLRAIDLYRQAVHRYADWVSAGQRLAIADELLSLAQARATQFIGREAAGDIASFDRLDNDRLVLQRTARQVEARRAFEKAQFDLSLLYRDADGAPLLVPREDVPAVFPSPLAMPASTDDALVTRPELLRLSAQREQAELEAQYSRNQRLPGVDILAQTTLDPTGYAEPELEVGVGIDFPLLVRSARGRTAAAQASLSRIDAEIAFQRDRVVTDIADARSALAAAEERIVQLDAELAIARKLSDGERRRFELGDSNLIFVNTRETAVADAASAVITARSDQLKASADYLAAIAGFSR